MTAFLLESRAPSCFWRAWEEKERGGEGEERRERKGEKGEREGKWEGGRKKGEMKKER